MRLARVVRMRWLVTLAAVGLLACASEVGRTDQGIVGGTISPQDRAAVALLANGEVFCSGVLIEPTLVLTSAHCLPPHVDAPLESIEVFFGADHSQGGEFRGVARALAHPAWHAGAIADDIGIIELSMASPVEPATLAASVDDVLAPGDTARAVGHGVFAGGDTGVVRSTAVTVDSVDDASVFVSGDGALPCDGDSGGPLFAASPIGEVVVGLHSRSNCDGAALAERVDRHIASLLSNFIAGIEPIDAEPEPAPTELVGACRAAGPSEAPWPLALVTLAGGWRLSRRRRPRHPRSGRAG